MSSLVARLSANLAKKIESESFNKVFQGLIITNAAPGVCVCEMKILDSHRNHLGTLHGGMIATLVDEVTTLALETLTPKTVSVNLNISYLTPAKAGENIIIDAKVMKQGKTLAFMEATIKEKLSDKIIAHGSHTKYILS